MDWVQQLLGALEDKDEVARVAYHEREPATAAVLAAWLAANSPVEMPADLDAFLQATNGFLLQWAARFGDGEVPLGSMQINTADDIVPVDGDLVTVNAAPAAPSSDVERLFALDAAAHGTVCLAYTAGSAFAGIWFLDRARQLWFLCSTFTDYLRLMLVHLGLPRWHLVYTDAGLDPVAKQWLRYLAPNRVAHALSAPTIAARSPTTDAPPQSAGSQ